MATKRTMSQGAAEQMKRAKSVGDDDDELDQLLEFEKMEEEDEMEMEMPDEAEAGGGAAATDDDAVVEIADASRWRRPPVDPDFTPATHSLAFQWTAIDMISGKPLTSHPRGDGSPLPGSSDGPVPVVRMYGVNASGNSVACFFHGFTPYLFCILPRGTNIGQNFELRMRDVS